MRNFTLLLGFRWRLFQKFSGLSPIAAGDCSATLDMFRSYEGASFHIIVLNNHIIVLKLFSEIPHDCLHLSEVKMKSPARLPLGLQRNACWFKPLKTICCGWWGPEAANLVHAFIQFYTLTSSCGLVKDRSLISELSIGGLRLHQLHCLKVCTISIYFYTSCPFILHKLDTVKS